MNDNLTSVIITTYNRADFLKKTLDSIENQTYKNVEIIVIDDGSTDEIAIKIKNICLEFSKCQYHWKSNTGQADSRNFGIEKAKGEYIGFCDDDDYWVLDKLEKQITILENYNNFDIVTGDIGFVDKEGTVLDRIKSHSGYNHGNIFENLLTHNRTSSVTPLLRKKVFEKSGLFNPKFTIAEDWDFWRRASFYHKFYAQNEIMAYVRIHGNNMTYKHETIYERIMLYRKLSKELLKWGKKKFNSHEFQLIESCERQKYQRIISNNIDTKWNQVLFLLSILMRHPKDGIYIISLFLRITR